MSERCLIVNADDFGRSDGITLGVIAAHQHGILTSASLTVRWPSARAAAAYARAHPDLGVGLHVDLGDWTWQDGRWERRHAPADATRRDAVAAEVETQLARFRDLVGADPTHLDSHHRAHQREPVRSVLREVADRLEVPLRHETRGVRHCGAFYGQTRTGRPLRDAVSSGSLVQLLSGLGPDPTELTCHPSLGGAEPYAEAGRDEVRALCAADVRRAVERLRVALCTFRDVPVAPAAARAALARGDAAGAVRRLESFARRHPRHAEPQLWLAEARLLADDLPAALRALAAALAIAPGSSAAAAWAVRLLGAEAPVDRARLRQSVAAIERQDPAATARLRRVIDGLRLEEARRARDVLGASRAGRAVRGRTPGGTASAAVARSLDLGDHLAAAALARRVEPGLVGGPVLVRLAAGLAAHGHLSAAVDAYDRALALRPADDDLREAREALRGERAVLSGRWTPPALGRRRLAPVAGRVLHVVGPSLPHVRAGYTVRTQYVARAQRDAGFDAHVVTGIGFPGDTAPGERMVHVGGVPHHRLAPGTTVPVALDVQLTVHLAALAALVERLRPAVLHAASDHRNARLAVAVGRAFGIPVVYEVRGFWEETWRAAIGRGAERSERYRWLRRREAAAARAAAAAVTLGDCMRDELVARGVPGRRVRVVPNAVDSGRFAPRPRDAALAAAVGIGARDLVVGCVSTLARHEGIELLLRAVARLAASRPALKALVVGDGPDRARLEALAADLGIAGRVRFTGAVPHEEAPRYYGLIDLFVVPRADDRVSELVTPLKPLEAMASGCAVVASDLGALRELVADGETGRLFRPRDDHHLALVLASVADDLGARRRLGAAARRWVVRHRTWAGVGRLYADLYQTLRVRTPA